MTGALATWVVSAAVSSAAAACPANLQAWRTSGRAEAGSEWTASFVEIRGDVGIFRELVLRFGEGSLAPAESKWFDAPAVLEPTAFHTRTRSFVGHELASLCGDLSVSEIATLAEKTRPRCFVDDSGKRIQVVTEVKLTDSDPGTTPAMHGDSIGVAVGGRDDGDVVCEPFENLKTALDDQQVDETDPSAVEPIASVLEEMERREAPLETGLAALPPARHVLEVLLKHDADRVPANLPSEFYLTVTAAPAPYAEALALERMLTARDTDEAVALKVLGDRASRAAAPLLRLKLRESTAADRDRIVALTLRALLEADPRIARLEAVPLLADPGFTRSSLGVFALTDSDIRKDLESLDATNPDALREAGWRTLAHLEATAPEEEIREAARLVRRATPRASSGSAERRVGDAAP